MKKQLINSDYQKMFQNGNTIWEIAEIYNDTYKNVSEAITGHRFEARMLSNEEKIKICEMYKNGISTVKIGDLYGVNNKPIAKILSEYGIIRTQNKFVRKYDLDEYYFDVIDTPNKAYVVGFLSADGSVNKRKQTISMSLEENDKEILEKICRDMKNNHPLEFIDYSNKHDFGYNYKNQYRMLAFSSHMCDSLERIGVIENKSLSLQFSKAIPNEFISHYIRGIFDGDGSIGVSSVEKYNGNLSVSITSTFDFCYELQKALNNIGIESRIVEASNHNGITASINITKKRYIKEFLDWIYKDADLYLKRKHDIYVYHYNLNNSLVA